MQEPFILTIQYKGEEYTFEARLVIMGYTHKFYVVVNGKEIVYEPDEERKYRAILNGADQEKVTDQERGMIREIGLQIEEIGA
jgi:saccharopine dehydrogenase-like NADP-dependent oxidoreductase